MTFSTKLNLYSVLLFIALLPASATAEWTFTSSFQPYKHALPIKRRLPPPTPSQVQNEALSTHNHFRAQHRAPALTWDSTLAKYAAQYASHCEFKHSHGPYGENIAAGYPSVTTAITAWYNEQQNYDYQQPGFSMQTGHFTQVVWKGSTRLGCASVPCDGKNGTPGNYVVCEYNPPGNNIADNNIYFNENVLPRSTKNS